MMADLDRFRKSSDPLAWAVLADELEGAGDLAGAVLWRRRYRWAQVLYPAWRRALHRSAGQSEYVDVDAATGARLTILVWLSGSAMWSRAPNGRRVMIPIVHVMDGTTFGPSDRAKVAQLSIRHCLWWLMEVSQS